MKEKKPEGNLPTFWHNFLIEEFKNETDRGAVVLTVSLLDNALTNLLKKYFAPTSDSTDELLEGSLAPLSSFSAKIQIAVRLGLISPRMARDLTWLRKMRNEFAHNVHGSSLDHGKIKDLLTNLTSSSSEILNGHKEIKSYPDGSRGDFLKITGIILFHLQGMIENPELAKPSALAHEEWIYAWEYQPPDSDIPQLKKGDH